jgi:hypothetical protein
MPVLIRKPPPSPRAHSFPAHAYPRLTTPSYHCPYPSPMWVFPLHSFIPPARCTFIHVCLHSHVLVCAHACVGWGAGVGLGHTCACVPFGWGWRRVCVCLAGLGLGLCSFASCVHPFGWGWRRGWCVVEEGGGLGKHDRGCSFRSGSRISMWALNHDVYINNKSWIR